MDTKLNDIENKSVKKIVKFKRIYIEITNVCNLNCSFCSKSSKSNREMTSEEFKEVLSKINNYTDYIYLHVKGEPLTHHNLDKILDITKKYNKKVCITTNGVFLKDKLPILKKYDNIYQINISLHSENNKKNYLEDIISSVNELSPYINYRFWTLDNNKMDNKTKEYIKVLKEVYNKEEIYDGIKLKDKVYLSLDNKFTWPSINNDYYNEKGTCLGAKTQLAILSDGTVSVCCLDSEGVSNLGNIYLSTMEDILASDKYQNILKGFDDHKVYLDICKHCSYKERFDKK